jgi:hypothetical protein
LISQLLNLELLLQKNSLKKNQSSFIPGVLGLIISTILLTLPGSSLPTEDWLDKIWFDKWVHIGLFGILVVLWCRAFHRKKADSKKIKKLFVIIAAIVLAYGILMEFVQGNFIPHRSFDFGDIVADAVGCFAGYFLSKRYLLKRSY